MVSSDVMEHLAEADIMAAIAEFRRVARRRLVMKIATQVERDRRPIAALHKQHEFMDVTALHTTTWQLDKWKAAFSTVGEVKFESQRGGREVLLIAKLNRSSEPARPTHSWLDSYLSTASRNGPKATAALPQQASPPPPATRLMSKRHLTRQAPKEQPNSTLPLAGQLPAPRCDPVRMQSRSCRQCAVVFSSGAMLAKKLGRIIDGYDLVFRMNLAPTHRYEEYAGSKTHYMALHDRVSTGTHLSPAARWTSCKPETRNGTGIVFGAQFLQSRAYSISVSNSASKPPSYLVLPKILFNDGLVRNGQPVNMPGTCNILRKHVRFTAVYPCSTGFELVRYLAQDTETFGCNVTVFGVSENVKDFHYYRANTRTHEGDTCDLVRDTSLLRDSIAGSAPQRELNLTTGFTAFTNSHNFLVEHDLLRGMHKRGELYLEGGQRP